MKQYGLEDLWFIGVLFFLVGMAVNSSIRFFRAESKTEKEKEKKRVENTRIDGFGKAHIVLSRGVKGVRISSGSYDTSYLTWQEFYEKFPVHAEQEKLHEQSIIEEANITIAPEEQLRPITINA